jgi:hypothetical protein
LAIVRRELLAKASLKKDRELVRQGVGGLGKLFLINVVRWGM